MGASGTSTLGAGMVAFPAPVRTIGSLSWRETSNAILKTSEKSERWAGDPWWFGNANSQMSPVWKRS